MIFVTPPPLPPQCSLLTPETSCEIPMLLFQSLSVTTNSSAFCNAHLQPCGAVICLLFVLVSKPEPNSILATYQICPFLSLLLYEDICHFFLSASLYKSCFLALPQFLSLFSLLKVLLLLSSFSLSMLSVLLKAGLTDPLLSSA